MNPKEFTKNQKVRVIYGFDGMHIKDDDVYELMQTKYIMKKIGTIGHVDHGKTNVNPAIKSLLEKEKYSVYQDEVFEIKNPYSFLSEKQNLSKTRLKKCERGLHEFQERNHDIVKGGVFIKKWACIHCGSFMHER